MSCLYFYDHIVDVITTKPQKHNDDNNNVKEKSDKKLK